MCKKHIRGTIKERILDALTLIVKQDVLLVLKDLKMCLI